MNCTKKISIDTPEISWKTGNKPEEGIDQIGAIQDEVDGGKQVKCSGSETRDCKRPMPLCIPPHRRKRHSPGIQYTDS